jgi:hypothetical protein
MRIYMGINIKYSSIIIITASIIFCSSSYAQIDKNGGSVYSIFGLGDLRYSSSNRTDAMGILGISLLGNYSNSLNPACWTQIPSTKFSTRFNYENTKSNDGINTSQRTYAGFEGFDLSIPINHGNGWVINLGLNPLSIVNYDIRIRGSALGENYTEIYNGNGGISRISAGFSYILFKYISFGAQFNYAFGNISKLTEIDFDNPNIFGTQNKLITSYSGVFANTGFVLNGFDKIFNSKKLQGLSLGVFFSTPAYLHTELNGNFKRITNTDSLSSISKGKVKIPWSGGIGITNHFSGSFLVSADVFFQDWNNFLIIPDSGSQIHPQEIRNNIHAGIGLEFNPSQKYEDPLYKRMSYRLGVSYTADYLRINGTAVNAYGVDAGVSVPISRYNSIDLLFGYKSRGTTTNGLVKDNVYRIGASVNIGELWFLKPSTEK